MTEKNYYEILGISKGADLSEIRKNYKQQARKWHPDKNPNNIKEAEKKMKEINEAYKILSDEDKKKKYDDGENVSVEKYGCDYDEEISNEEAAIKKYSNKKMNWIFTELRNFKMNYETNARVAREKGEEPPIISDYHLIRGKRLLQILYSYYFPIYKKMGWVNFHQKYVSVFQDNGLVWMDTTQNNSSWERNIEIFREKLDFAREKMGLSKLTDKELGLVEGNNQNGSPKIPGNNGPDKVNGNQEPSKIRDGVTVIEEYNKLYYYGKHETIRKYSELRGIIYNTPESWEKYKAVNPTILKEIDAKDIEIATGFQKVWTKDDENKIGEIKKFNESKLEKVKEAIKLMEKIIEGGNNYNPMAGNNQTGDKKRKADEFEAHNEVAKKSKTVRDELSHLIQEAQELSNYEALEAKIKEIDKYRGETPYNEQYKEEIKQLKSKLGDLDKDKHRENIIKKIKNELDESGIEENDLDEETKEELSKLRSGEIKDIGKINEFENKIATKAGEKKAKNNLSSLLEQAQKLLAGITEGTPDYLQKQLHKIKKDLYSFSFSTNVYCKSAYQVKEKDVKQMLEKLENYSIQNNQQPKSNFFRKEVVIPFFLLAIALTGAIIIVIRQRRRRLKKVK